MSEGECFLSAVDWNGAPRSITSELEPLEAFLTLGYRFHRAAIASYFRSRSLRGGSAYRACRGSRTSARTRVLARTGSPADFP